MHRMSEDYQGIFNEIAEATNETLQGLVRIVGSIRNSTGEVNTFAEELAGSADSLSRRTERNAAALEETSAALNEVEQSVNSASESANEARDSASGVVEEADRGIKIVESAATAMQEIKNSTDEITKFIDLIKRSRSRQTVGIERWRRGRRAGKRDAALPLWPRKCGNWQPDPPKRQGHQRTRLPTAIPRSMMVPDWSISPREAPGVGSTRLSWKWRTASIQSATSAGNKF